MPASVCQKLTSTPINEHEATWSDRGSADGTDIGGNFFYIFVNVRVVASPNSLIQKVSNVMRSSLKKKNCVSHF